MENITVKDIVAATGGQLLCGNADQKIEHLSIDSRTMKGNDLFVPLIGRRWMPTASSIRPSAQALWQC